MEDSYLRVLEEQPKEAKEDKEPKPEEVDGAKEGKEPKPEGDKESKPEGEEPKEPKAEEGKESKPEDDKDHKPEEGKEPTHPHKHKHDHPSHGDEKALQLEEEPKAEEAKAAAEVKEKKEAKTGERKKKWLLEDSDPLAQDESERLKSLDDTITNLAKGGKHATTTALLADNKAAANSDLVAEENQERLAALDSMLNSLATPDSNIQLLASNQNSVQAQQKLRLQSVQNFMASDNAVQDKVDHLVAFLADIPHAEPNEKKHERINKWDAGKVGGPKKLLSKDAANYDPLDEGESERKAGLADVLSNLAPRGRTKKTKEYVFESTTVAPQYLAAEAKTASNFFSLASNQDQLPQMIFGGAFLLVAAVLLAVMTKRSAKKQQQQRSKEDDAFAYALYH